MGGPLRRVDEDPMFDTRPNETFVSRNINDLMTCFSHEQ